MRLPHPIATDILYPLLASAPLPIYEPFRGRTDSCEEQQVKNFADNRWKSSQT